MNPPTPATTAHTPEWSLLIHNKMDHILVAGPHGEFLTADYGEAQWLCDALNELTTLRARAVACDRMEAALKLCIATLDNPQIGTWRYMEGSEIYEDFGKALNAARAALADRPQCAASALPAAKEGKPS